MMITQIVFVLTIILVAKSCGTSTVEDRLIGGHEAGRAESPHLVSLQKLGQHFCAGSILNKRWILTAAHCSYHHLLAVTVKAGKHDLSSSESLEQIHQIDRIIVHENYGQANFEDDIGLWKLKTPLHYNKGVLPIDLPRLGTVPEGYAKFSGWGLESSSELYMNSNVLQTSDLPILDYETCKQTLSSVDSNYVGLLSEKMICTGPLSGGHAICNGDSGGSLISKGKNNSPQLIGIASWTPKPCGRVNAPSVYTKVSVYVGWIAKTIH